MLSRDYTSNGMNQELRKCQNCKAGFIIEPEDFLFYEKIKVPPPTWCPECRLIRRYLFRNERLLFRRKDDATGKEIFSMIPPQDGITVYNHDYWWSDKWDPMQYGRDYDFSRSFFEQWRELYRAVPQFSNSILNLVKSEYCGNAGHSKNCYLCFAVDHMEDSAYCTRSSGIKDSFDLQESTLSELCHEGIMIDESYRAFFSVDCESCTDIWFSKSLVGCTNCFGCVNLRNKSYYIFNKPHTKETYAEKLKEFDLLSRVSLEKLRIKAQELWLRLPVKYMHGMRSVNSSGEHIQDSKNAKLSYFIHGCENIKFCQMLHETDDSYDYFSWGDPASQIYESTICGYECDKLKFCVECWPNVMDMEYCFSCHSSSNLFGCVGLRKKQYCILNKQYAKEDYEKLVLKIKKHMDEMPYISRIRNQESGIREIVYKYGEFFPSEFSIFAYNETPAQDFFPLTREEAEKRGYSWRDTKKREYKATMEASSLPDKITEVNDSIIKEVITCLGCKGPYRFIPMEYSFYKKLNLPLPQFCPECRFQNRKKFVNPPKYWKRKCQCAGIVSDNKIYKNTAEHPAHSKTKHCPNEFDTSYAPDKPDIVYCEACYNSELL